MEWPWMNVFGPGSAARDRGRRRRMRADLEILEGRELKDGGISLIAGGIVAIQGTASNDTATVAVDTTRNVVVVTLTGFDNAEFKLADVKGIAFVAGDGDDMFTNLTAINSLAFGGAGQDTLIGGSGIDVFDGGAGNDLLDGGAGSDILSGAGGNDTLLGGVGNDFLLGGVGTDTLNGGAGNDLVIGGLGTDMLVDTDSDFDLLLQ